MSYDNINNLLGKSNRGRREIKESYNGEGGTKDVKESRKRKKLAVRQRKLVTTERPLEKRLLDADSIHVIRFTII